MSGPPTWTDGHAHARSPACLGRRRARRPHAPDLALARRHAGGRRAPPRLAGAPFPRRQGPLLTVDPRLRRAGAGLHRAGRHLRGQRQGPRRAPALSHDAHAVPPGPGRRRGGAGVGGPRAVHPPARGPRGLEHAAGWRPLGADVPARAPPLHAARVGALVERAGRGQQADHGRQRHARARRRPGRPGRDGPPRVRRALARAHARPHAGARQRAAALRGGRGGDHRRPDALPHPGRRARVVQPLRQRRRAGPQDAPRVLRALRRP
jgi:hypothetical protein